MAIQDKKHLDQRTRFKLTQLITLEFPTAKMDDAQFAKYAEEKLGALVTRSHVASIRRTFDIPANKAEVRGGSRLAVLEKRVEELESHMEVLLRERAQKHANGH